VGLPVPEKSGVENVWKKFLAPVSAETTVSPVYGQLILVERTRGQLRGGSRQNRNSGDEAGAETVFF
jgi:hypothetical protein